jgi:hypothetical protein
MKFECLVLLADEKMMGDLGLCGCAFQFYVGRGAKIEK